MLWGRGVRSTPRRLAFRGRASNLVAGRRENAPVMRRAHSWTDSWEGGAHAAESDTIPAGVQGTSAEMNDAAPTAHRPDGPILRWCSSLAEKQEDMCYGYRLGKWQGDGLALGRRLHEQPRMGAAPFQRMEPRGRDAGRAQRPCPERERMSGVWGRFGRTGEPRGVSAPQGQKARDCVQPPALSPR